MAMQLLGDAQQWPSLVTANQLSPPYLTTNPGAIYGPPTSMVILPTAISAGTTTLQLLNEPQGINVVYFASAGGTALTAESVDVDTYDGQTLTLATPTLHAYPEGSSLQLFTAYNEGFIRVLLPGQTLLIPVEDTASFTLGGNGELVDTFGSDVAGSPFGFANGDIATVTGLSTLNQRMRAVIQTAVKSLPLHKNWGSRAGQVVGTPSQSVKWATVIREALMLLPEINNVTNTQTRVNGSSVAVTATVYVQTSESAIQLVNETFQLS